MPTDVGAGCRSGPGGGGAAALVGHAGNFVDDLAVRWLIALLGFPASFAGTFTAGGSTANLIGLGAARQHAGERLGLRPSRDGIGGHARAARSMLARRRTTSSPRPGRPRAGPRGTCARSRSTARGTHGPRAAAGRDRRGSRRRPHAVAIVGCGGDVNTGARRSDSPSSRASPTSAASGSTSMARTAASAARQPRPRAVRRLGHVRLVRGRSPQVAGRAGRHRRRRSCATPSCSAARSRSKPVSTTASGGSGRRRGPGSPFDELGLGTPDFGVDFPHRRAAWRCGRSCARSGRADARARRATPRLRAPRRRARPRVRRAGAARGAGALHLLLPLPAVRLERRGATSTRSTRRSCAASCARSDGNVDHPGRRPVRHPPVLHQSPQHPCRRGGADRGGADGRAGD